MKKQLSEDAGDVYQAAHTYAVTAAKHLVPRLPDTPPETYDEKEFETDCQIFQERMIAHFLFPDLTDELRKKIVEIRWRCVLLTGYYNATNRTKAGDKVLKRDEIIFTDMRRTFHESELWNGFKPVQKEILEFAYFNPLWKD